MKRNPSLAAIMLKDSAAFVSVCLIAGSWLLYWENAEKDKGHVFLWIAMIASMVGFVVLLSRISFYQDMYKRGLKISACVTAVVFSGVRRTNWVNFEYEYQGQKQRRAIKVPSYSKFTFGDKITILVDPDDPNRIVVRNLFDKL